MQDNKSSNDKEAYAVLKEISLDEKLREEASYREKAWRDELDRIQGAKKPKRRQTRNASKDCSAHAF